MKRLIRTAGAIVILATAPLPAAGHEGHDDAPGATATSAGGGSQVSVSQQARKNLGLRVEEAELRPMETTLAAIGEIAAIPDRSAAVTSRIAGRVSWVGAAEGDAVRAGQPVVEVESLQLGDPPPRARYSSPVGGTVIDRHLVPGDSVEPNTHLLEVADLREVLAVGRLFEGQIAQVAVGQPVRVRVPSYPGDTFEGVIERMGGALDPASRSLPVYVRIRNPDRKLLPRMRAELAIVTKRSERALVVPRSAILGDFGNAFVFAERGEDGPLFERVPVVTGLSDDRFVEVIDGVLPGDRVVSEGNYSLQFLPPASEGPAGTKDHPAAEASNPTPPNPTLLLALAAGVALAALLGGIAVLRRRSLRARA